MASDEDETVYCICRQPYDGERFMIECDVCKDWFHGKYVIKEMRSQSVEVALLYFPANCLSCDFTGLAATSIFLFYCQSVNS